MQDSPVRLLLVEDNPMHRKLIQKLLAGYPQLQCEVEAVDNLADGLTRLVKGGVDLVLPDSEELETLFRVRLVAPQVPVVVLTSLDDVKLAARAVESGAYESGQVAPQERGARPGDSPGRGRVTAAASPGRSGRRSSPWSRP